MSVSRKVGVCVIVALIINCVWFYATPYITLYHIKKAIEAQDAAEISRYMDFPSLRENLKTSLAVRKAAGGSNLFKSLRSLLSGAVTDPMVDALVTPEGIATMIKGEKIFGKKGGNGQTSGQENEDDQEYSMGYETINRFVLKTKNKDTPKKETGFVFTRKGMSWKLSAVRLPS